VRDGSFLPVSSKAAEIVKSLGRRTVPILALLALGTLAGAGATMPDGRPTPTGLEVPRWISLKSSHVRARQGPGLDYPILWEYRAAGLPVQVIAETAEWRKICDPEGAVAWIHRTVASGRRSVFNASDAEVMIHASRTDASAVRAPAAAIGHGAGRLRGGLVRGAGPAAERLGQAAGGVRDPGAGPVQRQSPSGNRTGLTRLCVERSGGLV
jgi:SH3-like domain-containing protein